MNGVEILCHPNIPKPLHGIAPRVIAGKEWWDAERRKAYAAAGYKCETCGTPKAEVLGDNKWLEAHEIYDYDYERGRITFVKLAALCPYCHMFIHSGRLEMLLVEEEISFDLYTEIIQRGMLLLKKAKLLKRWEKRHEHPDNTPWNGWRLVFEGKEYGPSTKNAGEWQCGKWREWKSPDSPKPMPAYCPFQEAESNENHL